MRRRVWERDELVLALDLYFTPDCAPDDEDPLVREVAALIGRSASAVALKLANFRAIDNSRTGGMPHHGARDEEVWDEFARRRKALRQEAERAQEGLLTRTLEAEGRVAQAVRRSILEGNYHVPDRMGPRKVRLRQDEFRRFVLEDYGHRCALCDIDIVELLNASHIIGWAEDEDNRLNPHNGICLCALHDRAFDRRLILIEPTLGVVLSSRAQRSPDSVRRLLVGRGRLRMPSQYPPDPGLLARASGPR